MLLSIRLKIRNFWKKHKYKVIIGLLIWIIILIVNYILKFNKDIVSPSIGYTPHESIMDTEEKVPTSIIPTIGNWMEEFHSACNQKNYEVAYQLLSEEYRKENTLEDFKSYVDDIYDSPKTYVMQNYSNQKNIYIYRVKIMDDILSTGLTGKDTLEYVEERVVVKKDGDKLEFSIGNSIMTEQLDKVFENEHMKVTVNQREIYYDAEIYTITIENRTDYTIVLNNYSNLKAITLDIGDDQRNIVGDAEVVVQPESKLILELKFTKFFDDERSSRALKFDSVRIFEEYNGKQTDDEALRKYSFEIAL